MADEVLQGDDYVVDSVGGPYTDIPYLANPSNPLSKHISHGDIPLSMPEFVSISISANQPSSWTTILDLDQDDAPYGGVIPYGMWIAYDGQSNAADIRYLEVTIDDQPTKEFDLANLPVISSGGSTTTFHQQHLRMGFKWSKNITIRANKNSSGAAPQVNFGYHILGKDD